MSWLKYKRKCVYFGSDTLNSQSEKGLWWRHQKHSVEASHNLQLCPVFIWKSVSSIASVPIFILSSLFERFFQESTRLICLYDKNIAVSLHINISFCSIQSFDQLKANDPLLQLRLQNFTRKANILNFGHRWNAEELITKNKGCKWCRGWPN